MNYITDILYWISSGTSRARNSHSHLLLSTLAAALGRLLQPVSHDATERHNAAPRGETAHSRQPFVACRPPAERQTARGCLHCEDVGTQRQSCKGELSARRIRVYGGARTRNAEDVYQNGTDAGFDGHPHSDGSGTRWFVVGRHSVDGLQHASGVCHHRYRSFRRRHRLRCKVGSAALVPQRYGCAQLHCRYVGRKPQQISYEKTTD